MKHNRQCDAILDEMLAGRRITQLEMLQEHGVGRLASRISDLRNEGYLITSRRVNVEKADGSRANVAQYWMVPGMFCGKKQIEIPVEGNPYADSWIAIQYRNLEVRIFEGNRPAGVIEANRIKTDSELRAILEQYIRSQEG